MEVTFLKHSGSQFKHTQSQNTLLTSCAASVLGEMQERQLETDALDDPRLNLLCELGGRSNVTAAALD